MTVLIEGYCGVLRLTIVVVVLGVAIFDLTADWLLFSKFQRYAKGETTTNALLGFLCVSSLLFLLEVRNAVYAVRLFNKHLLADMDGWEDGEVEEGEENKRPTADIDSSDEVRSLNSWQETVSFLLLAWEDLPTTIILFIAFSSDNCELFRELFEEGFIANLSLLGTFVSAGFKLLLSFFFCIGKCVMCRNFVKGCRKETCCCFCRVFRPVLALILLAFSGYLYFTFNEEGQDAQPTCS